MGGPRGVGREPPPVPGRTGASMATGGGEEEEVEEPPESTAMSTVEAEKFVQAAKKENDVTPKSFMDLVDRCLLLCEDCLHDVTWDAMVIRYFQSEAKAARVDGTLFTKDWGDEPTPPFLTKEIKRRRQVKTSEEVAQKELEGDRIKDSSQRGGEQEERMVLGVQGVEERQDRKTEGAARITDQCHLELAMLLEKERGLVTPQATRLEAVSESRKTEGKRRSRRGGRKSRRRRLLDFQIFLSKEYNLPPTRLMMEAVAQSLQSVGRRQGVRRSRADESESARPGRWGRRKQEEAELTASPVLPRSVIGNVQMEAKPSMAGRRQEKEAELIASSCLTSTRRSTLSPLTETMSASRANNPYMLRWSMLGVGEGEPGLEMAWVDQCTVGEGDYWL